MLVQRHSSTVLTVGPSMREGHQPHFPPPTLAASCNESFATRRDRASIAKALWHCIPNVEMGLSLLIYRTIRRSTWNSSSNGMLSPLLAHNLDICRPCLTIAVDRECNAAGGFLSSAKRPGNERIHSSLLVSSSSIAPAEYPGPCHWRPSEKCRLQLTANCVILENRIPTPESLIARCID